MKKTKTHFCRLDDCEYFGRVYDDDDDICGCPWCHLANDTLPDECYWPFNCIALEQLAEAEEYADDM